jgi:hypothetical protein
MPQFLCWHLETEVPHWTAWTPCSESDIMTDSQSASLCWNKHPLGAYDRIFITIRQLRACWSGALSLTRGQVCHLQLLLASAVIFWVQIAWYSWPYFTVSDSRLPFLLPPTTCMATMQSVIMETCHCLSTDVWLWLHYSSFHASCHNILPALWGTADRTI